MYLLEIIYTLLSLLGEIPILVSRFSHFFFLDSNKYDLVHWIKLIQYKFSKIHVTKRNLKCNYIYVACIYLNSIKVCCGMVFQCS